MAKSIPDGLCQCNCGRKTAIIPYSNKARGLVKGQPRRFIHGHHLRIAANRFHKTPSKRKLNFPPPPQPTFTAIPKSILDLSDTTSTDDLSATLNPLLMQLPSVRIMIAILQDILDHQDICAWGLSHKRKCKICEENREWVGSEEEDFIFSFINCCSVLGLDADRVRSVFMDRFAQREKRPIEKEKVHGLNSDCVIRG